MRETALLLTLGVRFRSPGSQHLSKIPSSENISVLWPAGMYPGTDLGSSRAGRGKVLQPSTWKDHAALDLKVGNSDKESLKLAFQTLTLKNMHF